MFLSNGSCVNIIFFLVVNNSNLEDEEGKEPAVPVYAALNGNPDISVTYTNSAHAHNGSSNGNSTSSRDTEAARQQQLNSSLVYYEVGPSPTTTEDPQDYALPVASGHSTIQSQPYEVPVTSLQSHHSSKVRLAIITERWALVYINFVDRLIVRKDRTRLVFLHGKFKVNGMLPQHTETSAKISAKKCLSKRVGNGSGTESGVLWSDS